MTKTKEVPLRSRFVLDFENLDFGIVSDFVLWISDLSEQE